MKQILLLITLMSVTLVTAGTTSFSVNPNLNVGDCWNSKTVKSIEITDLGYTLEWERGCLNISNSTEEIPEEIIPIQEESCEKIYDGEIKIIVYGDKEEMIDFGKWVYNEMQTESPFNEFTYSLYYENEEGNCNGTKRDFRIGFGDINSIGLAYWDDVNPGHIWIRNSYSNKKWHFLLFHELLHIYLKSGHSLDNSIMDKDGGSGKIFEYQIEIARENLK